jgi:hypothetical protein
LSASHSDWGRVTALFEEALSLDGAARETLIAREEAVRPSVAREVRAMLRAHDSAGDFLEDPAWAKAPELLSESLDAPLAGRRIGPYHVREQVGHGGMGVVYAAEDERLGRTVALKMLPPSFSRDAVARERLSREARAAAALSHPAIATIYAFEEIDGDLFIASELVRGETLRTSLASGALNRERVLDVLIQIAGALEAAHAQGIVHRDLKPENVLCTRDGRVKIVDFGIARHLTPVSDRRAGLTLTGTQLGTPGYMAPEQLRGHAVDARADIFAFGIIAYELATGVHPFGGSDPAALLERLVSDNPPLSQAIEPPGLDSIVRTCLRGDPLARYASGAELLAALRTLHQTGAASFAPPAALRGASWWQFHQAAVATLMTIAVLIIWQRKSWIDPYGSTVFIAVVILATVAGTLRLHMWFVSQFQSGNLLALRARVLRPLIFCESLLAALLLAVGVALSGPHDGTAAQLIIIALLIGMSLIVIEPATTRASLPPS